MVQIGKLGCIAPTAEQRSRAPLLGRFLTRSLPPAPKRIDYTQGVQYGIFGNDRIGDCVAVALANYCLTAAAREGRKLAFTEREVTSYYYSLTGGADNGLVISDTLTAARKDGFPLSGAHRLAAWVRIDHQDLDAIRACMAAFWGVFVGADLPTAIEGQEHWDASGDVSGGNAPGTLGGHAMYCGKCDEVGPKFVTWYRGQLQPTTWAWWRQYVTEAYALLDEERAAVVGVDWESLLYQLDLLAR